MSRTLRPPRGSCIVHDLVHLLSDFRELPSMAIRVAIANDRDIRSDPVRRYFTDPRTCNRKLVSPFRLGSPI
jgi:hypothetical protein